MIENKYKVPLKLWNTFKGELSKSVFNSVMEQMLHNQDITKHPQMFTLPNDHWETISHNAACYAAWAACNEPIKEGDQVITPIDNGLHIKIINPK